MSPKSEQSQKTHSFEERVQAQLGMLVSMFILGIAVNLIGLPSEVSGAAKTASTIFLILHGLLGFGLIVNAGIVIHLASKKSQLFTKQAQLGAIVIVLTFIAGIFTNATKSNWWSFVMALGFAASLPIYGSLLLRARAK